jgi:hypothetical protein
MMLSLLGGCEVMARWGAAKMTQEVGGWPLGLGMLGGRAGFDVPALKVMKGTEIRKEIQRSVCWIGIPLEE